MTKPSVGLVLVFFAGLGLGGPRAPGTLQLSGSGAPRFGRRALAGFGLTCDNLGLATYRLNDVAVGVFARETGSGVVCAKHRAPTEGWSGPFRQTTPDSFLRAP